MELRRASSLELDGGTPVHGGTEVVPLLRAGLLQTETLVDIRGVVPRGIDGDAVEAALAANGVGGDGSTVATADGGLAEITLEDDAAGFLIAMLTPELARIVFDVATSAGLAILPVDGTPTALVPPGAEAEDELEPLRVRSPHEVFDALRESVATRDEARGARPA